MATYNLTEAQLDAALTANFDAQTRADILAYLNAEGVFDAGSPGGTSVVVDSGPYPSDPSAEIASITGPVQTVNTDNFVGFIGDSQQDFNLAIVGSGDAIVATSA